MTVEIAAMVEKAVTDTTAATDAPNASADNPPAEPSTTASHSP